MTASSRKSEIPKLENALKRETATRSMALMEGEKMKEEKVENAKTPSTKFNLLQDLPFDIWKEVIQKWFRMRVR